MSALNPRTHIRAHVIRSAKPELPKSNLAKLLKNCLRASKKRSNSRRFARLLRSRVFPFYCCRVSMCVWLDTRFASARCVCIWFGIAQLCTGTMFVLAGAVPKKWARSSSRAAREASVAIQNGATDCTHLTPILTSTQPPVHAVADSPKWQVQGPHQGKHQS